MDVKVPATERGTWELEFDLVAEHVSWFKDQGGTPTRLRFTVD
jgi:hypothetical protein